VLLIHTELFVYDEKKMLKLLKLVRIDLNDLQTVISISEIKNTPDALQL